MRLSKNIKSKCDENWVSVVVVVVCLGFSVVVGSWGWGRFREESITMYFLGLGLLTMSVPAITETWHVHLPLISAEAGANHAS